MRETKLTPLEHGANAGQDMVLAFDIGFEVMLQGAQLFDQCRRKCFHRISRNIRRDDLKSQIKTLRKSQFVNIESNCPNAV